jgi:hypothetical protein
MSAKQRAIWDHPDRRPPVPELWPWQQIMTILLFPIVSGNK